jgi:hypothetical protein
MNLSWPARATSQSGPAPGRRDAAPILPWAVRRDVLLIIALKLLAIAAIYALFFAPHAQPEPRPADIAAHLLDR